MEKKFCAFDGGEEVEHNGISFQHGIRISQPKCHLLVYSFDDTLAIFIRTELPPGGAVAGNSDLLGPPSQLNGGDDTVPYSRKLEGSLISLHHIGTMLANGYTLPHLSFESIVLSIDGCYLPPVNHMVVLVNMVTDGRSMTSRC